MNDLLEALADIERTTDVRWTDDAFQRVLALARLRELGPDALRTSERPGQSQYLPLYGSAAVRLMNQLRTVLETPSRSEQAWPHVGTLLCWATDVYVGGRQSLRKELLRRARDERGVDRHDLPIPHGADEMQFENAALRVLEILTSHVESRNALPPHVDSFFAKGLSLASGIQREVNHRAAGVPSLPNYESSSETKRLLQVFEALLEKFLSALFRSSNPSTQWIALEFVRGVVGKSGKAALSSSVRGILDKILLDTAFLNSSSASGPTIGDYARMLVFLLGSLNAEAPGSIEAEVADDLVRGGYNAVHFSVDLAQRSGEDIPLLEHIAQLVRRKWSNILKPESTATSLNVLLGLEVMLEKMLSKRQRLDGITLVSLEEALLVAHSLFTLDKAELSASAEARDQLKAACDASFRISLLLALSSENPGDQFSAAMVSKPAGFAEFLPSAVRVIALALGCSRLERSVEELMCRVLIEFLDRDCLSTVWIIGQVALDAPEWTSQLNYWKYDYALAAHRVANFVSAECARDVRQGERQANSILFDELERLEALYLGLEGLRDRGSIRHLQDTASFYVHFGKQKGFNQAAERFLAECAQALGEFRRYWECGNCYIMLATCRLARKEWSAACLHFQNACTAYEKCGAYAEADAVRGSCRAFMAHADNPREWDWCIRGGGGTPGDNTAIAHYFLVGAVGVGDPDLTVLRCVSLTSRSAFDDAVTILEQGSQRKRVHGELRWVSQPGGAIVPHFFPVQSALHEEYGFWMQRIWPIMGEDTSEHCPQRFGIAGEPYLLIEVSTRRGLSPLISAISVVVRGDGTTQNALDVPFGWIEDDTEIMPRPPDHPPALDQLNIPLPPGPPPGEEPSQVRSSRRSKREKQAPSTQESSFVATAAEFRHEQQQSAPIRGAASAPISLEGNLSSASVQPQVPSTAEQEVETEAERRKRAFRERQKQRAKDDTGATETLQSTLHTQNSQSIPESPPPPPQESPPPPPPSEPIVIGGAANDEDETDFRVSRRHKENDGEDTNGEYLLLRRRPGATGNNASPQTSTRRVQLVEGSDLEEIMSNRGALPSKKMTLVDQERASSSSRKIFLEDDGEDASGIRSSSSLPTTNRAHDPMEEEVANLPPHSASRAFFNIGGARLTVEEAALVQKFSAAGEAWIRAELLSSSNPSNVSLKLSAETRSLEIFSDPAFDLLETIPLSQGVALDPLPSDNRVLELFSPERIAKGNGTFLFSCDRPDLFRALVNTFKTTSE